MTTTAPATKAAPVIKSEQLPSKVRNANAKMGRHHHKHYRHHRHHKHMGMLKVKAPKHVVQARPGQGRDQARRAGQARLIERD